MPRSDRNGLKQTGTFNPPAATLLHFSFTVDHFKSLAQKYNTHGTKKKKKEPCRCSWSCQRFT